MSITNPKIKPNNQDIVTLSFHPPADSKLTVEVLSLDELKNRAPAAHFKKFQRADFYRLIGLVNGVTQPVVDFSTFVVKRGDWLLVKPGQVFRYDFSLPCTGLMVVFRPDSLPVSGKLRAHDPLQNIEDLACLHSLSDEQHDWMERSVLQLRSDGEWAIDFNLRNELLQTQLVGILLRLYLWQFQNPSLAVFGNYEGTEQINYKRFYTLLNADFLQHHDAQYYARTLGMSERNLSRSCVAATGISTKAIINQRIILEAKRWLAHTSMTVQAIGWELGFHEPTNFVKFFHNETKTTPLHFRKSLLIFAE